jgi:hypothetical protein
MSVVLYSFETLLVRGSLEDVIDVVPSKADS